MNSLTQNNSETKVINPTGNSNSLKTPRGSMNDLQETESTRVKKNSFFKNFKKFFGKKTGDSGKEISDIMTNFTPVNNEGKTMWVPDEKAMTCYNCQKLFSTLFLRKHHCRICGNVFCKECSSKNVEGKYWGSKKAIKVCDYCYIMYNKLDVECLVEVTNNNFIHLNTEDGEDEIELNETTLHNLKRETKLSEYCKKVELEREENLNFLKLDLEEERENLKHLNKYSEILIKSIVEEILKSEGLFDQWFKLVYYLTLKTINNVCPTFQDLKDSLNINDYVKIKIIEYKDATLSRFIDGYAMNKNVCSKKMNILIDEPKILLLDCGLDYNRKAGLVNFDSDSLQQEPAYIDILMKKINLVNPDVILINKAVSRKIQEKLSDKISIVISVKSHSLKRIARCTKSYVLPSTDLIDSQTILGRCKSFRVEKFKQNSSNKNSLHVNDYNLMVFEGCNALLGCTLILSGPNKSELKKVKSLMRIILLTARDIYLQKHLLYFMFYKIPQEVLNTDVFHTEIKEKLGKNFELKPKIQREEYGNSNISSNINQIDKYESEQHNVNEFVSGFDTSIILDDKTTLNVIKLTMAIGNQQINLDKFWGYNIDKNVGGSISTQDLNEPDILRMINSICGEPQNLELCYFSNKDQRDKPFGKLIIDLCNEKELKCDDCKKLKSSHIYYIYKNTGRIKIQMINQEDYSDKIYDYIINTASFSKGNADIYSTDIFSYGVCKICKLIVTPLIKLPREIFNLSLAKFIKIMLYNHNVKNRVNDKKFNILDSLPFVTNTCNHLLFKEIYRIYITKLGCIKISYEDAPIYSIEGTPLKFNNAYYHNTLNDFIENQIFSTNKKGKAGCEVVKNYMKNLSDELYEIPNNTNPNMDETKMSSIIKKLNVIFKGQYDKLTEIQNIIDNWIVPQTKFDNLFKLISYKKLIFGRIFQVKIIYQQLRKCVKKLKKSNIPQKISAASNEENHSVQSSSKPSVIQENNQDTSIDKHPVILDLLREINFNDENHTKFSNDVNIDDISSIISYTLMSDKYQEFISAQNKFKLLGLKCEIKSIKKERSKSKESTSNEMSKSNSEVISQSNNYTPLTKHKTNLISDQTKNNLDHSFDNIIPEEEINETSLLFEPKRNSYSNYQKLDDHKINQLLETELLSDEKASFTYVFNNNLSYLENSILTFELSRKVKIKEEEKSEQDEKLQFKEEKLLFPSENMKVILEEIDNIKKEINTNKEINKSKGKKQTETRIIDEEVEVEVNTYFPRQFEALRATYCTTYEDFILSLSTSYNWSSCSGGKSKADFFKSFDNRYILKCVNKHEFKMFLETGFQYFHHKAKFLFHKMPSAIAKILGAYKIKIKIRQNKIENRHIFLMENLFYDLETNKNLKCYDLKGSKSRRYIAKRDHKPNQVLPDTNFKEDFKGEPIPLEKNMYELMKAAVHNDSLILSKMNVVDYSLLLIIDDADSEETSSKKLKRIRIGIIDYCRKYTWDKQLEHVGKIIINRLQVPTIVNPINYKERFKEAISNYFIGL